jgi:hypothetical protein
MRCEPVDDALVLGSLWAVPNLPQMRRHRPRGYYRSNPRKLPNGLIEFGFGVRVAGALQKPAGFD